MPQEIKIEGCTSESIKLTFTAKAGNQGGFKGTETDVLTTQIRQQKSCNRQAISSAKSNPKQTKQIENTPPIESNFPEFNSPLFLILRLLLFLHQPGIEPGNPAWKADMLATTPMMRWRLETSLFMHEVGFEPTKRFASDLKSLPFDQTREP